MPQSLIQEGSFAAARPIPARSILPSLCIHGDEQSESGGYAMLAGRGIPGGFEDPEVPVLALEFPYGSISFRAG